MDSGDTDRSIEIKTMKDWVRILDASAEAHVCKLDHKDCKVLADDIRALLREEETARKEIAELKNRIEHGTLACIKHTCEIAELKARIKKFEDYGLI